MIFGTGDHRDTKEKLQLGVRHPVEFVQPPLVCGAAAEYMPFSFLFSGGIIVEKGLVCVPSTPVVQCALWCCSEQWRVLVVVAVA
jgi:hypothetical protein